ncbi:MAG: prepilin-type N-terminal cleavage/methylation domain-containing protein [Planctomycetota bacterium]|nr:prepilin-type N-terminal cleavage/methylation domain-containing protein [Planctomycetota bacterium]
MTRAFSLIEVLIAIVVLALGLLGLAAVFPAVIAQQREASDTVQGVSAERSVSEVLLGHARLNERPAPNANDTNPADRRGWGVLAKQPEWSPEGGWTPPTLVADLTQIPDGAGLGLVPTTGWMAVGQQGGITIALPLADRLTPVPYTALEDPRFVWDMAARRVDVSPTRVRPATTTRDDDQVQVAIFVRRIDPAIRRPDNRPLRELFLNDTLPLATRRVPVASDARGRPTFDGVGGGTAPNYAPIFSFRIEDEDFAQEAQGNAEVEWIVPDTSGGFDDLRPYVAQVGQKFVDQAGGVHEVIEVQAAGNGVPALRLRVSPPVPARLGADISSLPEGELRMLATAQTPAAVVVRTIRP